MSFLSLYIFNDVTPIISTWPIFTKFAGLVELWLQINDLYLVFRSFKGCCYGYQFLLVLSASIHRIGFAPEVVEGVVAEVMKGRKRYLTIVLQHNEVTNIQSVQSLGRKPDSAEDRPVTKHCQSWLYTCKLRFNSDLRKRMSIGATEGHSVIAGM